LRSQAALCALAIVMAVMAASSAPVRAQQPAFNVVYQVSLDSHFGLYSTLTEEINLLVSGEPGPVNGSVVVDVYFSFIFKGVNGLPLGANYTIQSVSQHPVVNLIRVTFSPGTGSFAFSVTGKSHDSSVALRGAATITYAPVFMNAPPYNPVSYQVLIPTSPRFQIVSVFPGTGPDLTTQYVSINGTDYLATGFSYGACFVQNCAASVGANTISIVYQPEYFNYFMAAYVVFAAGVLVGIGILIRQRRQGALKALDRGGKIVSRVLRSFDSRKLLAILVGISVAMVTLAFVFGPSPSPRAYLAATPQTTQVLGPYITAAGFTYLTPTEAGDEFDVMSSLNTYYTVIIADYPPPLQSTGFASTYRIIAVSGYANSTLVKDLQTYYGQEVGVVNTPQLLEFDLSLQAKGYASNHLGLPVSPQTYASATLVEGILSLSLPFFALAFFARYMVESSSRGIVRLAQGAAFSFLVFMFGELVYIQTDILLTLPVALHATISAQETAIGVLGFGGGSRPRMVLGALGFLFGTFAGTLKGTRIDKVVVIGFVSALLFLLVDPLQLGQDFYNVLLQILSSEGGTAFGQAAYTQLRAFIGIFMNAFGNESIPTFFSQHGAIIFFAGAVPFALYTYLRRSTATLLLIFSTAVAGLGYVRIGDQDPLKAIASTTPGFAMALLFVIAFLAIDRVERFLRTRLGLG
jgi:hypothetical protein